MKIGDPEIAGVGFTYFNVAQALGRD